MRGLPQKLVNLADLLKRDGRFAEAERLYCEALDLWMQIVAKKSFRCLSEAARTISKIVTLLTDTGRKCEAEEFMGMAQELRYAFQEIKEIL